LKFTRIPETTFQKLQLNAGIMLTAFDPTNGTVAEDAIMGATSGGINFSAVPTFSDFGEDIDNAPTNVKEMKMLEKWDVTMSGSFVTVDVKSAKMLVGAADIDAGDQSKIVPRNDLMDSDFTDVWWVGDYSDQNGESNGGFVAIHMINALNTGGFSVQSTNKGKGEFAFEFTGHYSLSDQSKVPFEVFVKTGTEE
jgi:hypothetical protein